MFPCIVVYVLCGYTTSNTVYIKSSYHKGILDIFSVFGDCVLIPLCDIWYYKEQVHASKFILFLKVVNSVLVV